MTDAITNSSGSVEFFATTTSKTISGSSSTATYVYTDCTTHNCSSIHNYYIIINATWNNLKYVDDDDGGTYNSYTSKSPMYIGTNESTCILELSHSTNKCPALSIYVSVISQSVTIRAYHSNYRGGTTTINNLQIQFAGF